MNYYYALNKDSCDVERLYQSFENILKSSAILCRKMSGVKRDVVTYNGDEFISLSGYVRQSAYKVPRASRQEFLCSNLKNIFANYGEYTAYLKQETLLKPALSSEKFFKQNPASTKKDYYRYLDGISRKYPIDLKIFFKNVKKDEIIDEIFKKINKISKIKDVGYFYANENCYTKYIKPSNGIVFVIDNKIKTENTILIPNLESDFFSLPWQNKMANSRLRRYTNLIGEVQVKNAVPLKNVKYLIVGKDVDKQKLELLMKKYNVKLKLKTKAE